MRLITRVHWTHLVCRLGSKSPFLRFFLLAGNHQHHIPSRPWGCYLFNDSLPFVSILFDLKSFQSFGWRVTTSYFSWRVPYQMYEFVVLGPGDWFPCERYCSLGVSLESQITKLPSAGWPWLNLSILLSTNEVMAASTGGEVTTALNRFITVLVVRCPMLGREVEKVVWSLLISHLVPIWCQRFHIRLDLFLQQIVPSGSMSGIFTYIYHRNQPNVGSIPCMDCTGCIVSMFFFNMEVALLVGCECWFCFLKNVGWRLDALLSCYVCFCFEICPSCWLRVLCLFHAYGFDRSFCGEKETGHQKGGGSLA